LAIMLLTACASVPQRNDDREVRAVVDAVVGGLAHMDADAIVANFADDATFFFPESANQPARVEGKAAIREVFERAFAEWRKSGTSSPVPQLSDMRSDVFGDFAVITFHIRGAVLSRRTFVLRRIGGAWRVVHLHASNIRL
jgi:ketosteroid isomerase-like protein